MRFGNVEHKELQENISVQNNQPLSCVACKEGREFDIEFSMAFQPLVDLSKQQTYGYEALVRGVNGEPAFTVINKVTAQNIYRFDQSCRVKAIALAARNGISQMLSINFLPGAIYKPELCIKTTIAAAQKYNFPLSQLNFELVETDHVTDIHRLEEIARYYQDIGLSISLDDFGTGYANLDWLAYLNPNAIKVDISLVRDIDQSSKRRLIVSHLYKLATSLSVDVIAEGVETKAERDCLAEIGITKQQGYFFAKPQFEQFVPVPEACLK